MYGWKGSALHTAYLYSYLIGDVVNENKYDNGDGDHDDGFNPDLEILCLLPVDLGLKAAVLKDGFVEVHSLPTHNVFSP